METYWDWLSSEIQEEIRFHVVELMIPIWYEKYKLKIKLVHEEMDDETFCLKYSIGWIDPHRMNTIFSTNNTRKWHIRDSEVDSCIECFSVKN